MILRNVCKSFKQIVQNAKIHYERLRAKNALNNTTVFALNFCNVLAGKLSVHHSLQIASSQIIDHEPFQVINL